MAAQVPAKAFAPGLHRSANQFFAPVYREFDRLFDQLSAGWTNLTDLEFTTRMDVRDTKNGLEITIEAPGVDEKDIEIAVRGNVLTISGEKKSENDRAEGGYRISERSYGSFSRSIDLPASVDADEIKATMENGVLKLVAPRNGQPAAKTIPISSAR